MTTPPATFNSTSEGIGKAMQNRLRLTALLTMVLGVAVPGHALAYIGPGAGLGAIAVTAAFFLGVCLLVIGLVWYPLKRLFKRKRAAPSKKGVTDGSE